MCFTSDTPESTRGSQYQLRYTPKQYVSVLVWYSINGDNEGHEAPILRASGGGAMKQRIPRPKLSETKTRMFQSPSWPVTQYTPDRGDGYYADHVT